MLIPNPDLDFRNLDPKIHFREIWAQNIKDVRFAWKLVHMVSQACWFLFQHWFSEFQIPISFLGKFGPEKSTLFDLPENWHTCCLEVSDSCSNIIFLNLKT